MKKIGDFIVRFIDYVFFAVMLLIFVSSLLSFADFIPAGWIRYAAIFFLVILVCFFIVFGNSIITRLKSFFCFVGNISAKQMFVVIFLFVLLSKVFFIFLFNPDASKYPDMATYQSFAYQLANDGRITEYVYSAYLWKYEVIYGLLLSPAVKIFGEDTKVLLIFLSILFAILSVLLFDIIRSYVGKNKAFVAIVLFNLLPIGLLETQLLIHETALLFFYIVSLWFLIKALEHKNEFIRLFPRTSG